MVIYSHGLVPYIEEEILFDVCFRLAKAQPSLGLNIHRADAESFFSYRSQRLQKNFPVVLRIVDRLKSHWQSKVSRRAEEMNKSDSRGTGGFSEDDVQPRPHLGGSGSDTSQEPAVRKAESHPSAALEPGPDEPSAAKNAAASHPEFEIVDEEERPAPAPAPVDGKWEEIEISFLSDERVQIRRGKTTETLNYAEFGFKDGRTGNPNQAWVLLRRLAEKDGWIANESEACMKWPKVEKRVQEIRSVFRERFGIESDPIPFVEKSRVQGKGGYDARFKISCGPSYHT